MLALAYLAALNSGQPQPRPGQHRPMALLPLSLAEIRRLLASQALSPAQRRHPHTWSAWGQQHNPKPTMPITSDDITNYRWITSRSAPPAQVPPRHPVCRRNACPGYHTVRPSTRPGGD